MEINTNDLKQAVERMHHCTAQLMDAVAVSETFQGEPVWQGIVHVFELTGHPTATRCYAWSSPWEGSDKRRFFAVLHIPPITSAQDAVRAAIVHEYPDFSGVSLRPHRQGESANPFMKVLEMT
jgi:hypothetical protein